MKTRTRERYNRESRTRPRRMAEERAHLEQIRKFQEVDLSLTHSYEGGESRMEAFGQTVDDNHSFSWMESKNHNSENHNYQES